MKTLTTRTKEQNLKSEFIEFLKSIDLKEFKCEPEFYFFEDPSEWNQVGELKYQFKDYEVVIPYSLEYDLEEEINGENLTITTLDLEPLHLLKGKDIFEPSDFDIEDDNAIQFINNPYDTTSEERIYKADVVLDIPAKSKQQAKAILSKVVSLLNEEAKDVSWVYYGDVETKQEIYKRLIG